MPRTGSTSLAAMLGCHHEISCLIEPFTPLRYGERFRKEVSDVPTLRRALDLIWIRWIGVKHVWQSPHSWPFESRPELNEEIVRHAPTVVSLERENLLQRYVSWAISRKLQFWIGSKQEFQLRLERIGFPEFEVETVRKAIYLERTSLARRRALLADHPRVFRLKYEALFGDGVTPDRQIMILNEILTFLGYSSLEASTLSSPSWKQAADARDAKWNTPEIYDRISNARLLDDKLGSDETGWLFR